MASDERHLFVCDGDQQCGAGSVDQQSGTERLDGTFIEKGEAWDARGVVPPSRTVGECAVWVMYLGASG